MKAHPQIIILFFILFSTSHALQSQSMSVTGGVGTTHYFDIIKKEHLQSDYGTGTTSFIKIDFNDIASTGFIKNFAFKFEKQSGEVNYSSRNIFCGLGLPADLIFTSERIDKYTLSAISYPLSISLGNNIRLKSGVAISKNFLMKANNSSENQTFTDEFPFKSQIESRSYNADAAFEFQFGSFTLQRGISIVPTYNAFISLTPEFNGSYNTQSLRQSLGVAVIWGLKKK